MDDLVYSPELSMGPQGLKGHCRVNGASRDPAMNPPTSQKGQHRAKVETRRCIVTWNSGRWGSAGAVPHTRSIAAAVQRVAAVETRIVQLRREAGNCVACHCRSSR